MEPSCRSLAPAGVSLSGPSVTRGSLSVAELFAELGSVVPAGATIVAVLLSVPVAAPSMVPLSVYVTDAPTGRLTVSLMLPAPDGEPQVPPPAAAHVQVGVRMA